MRNFRLLFELSLKNYTAKNPNAKVSKYRAVQYSAIAFLLIIVVFALSAGVYFLGTLFKDREGVEYIVSCLLMASQLFVLIYGLSTTLSVIYFSKDNEFLSALPVKPHEIFLSKLSMIYSTNAMLSTVILLPALIALGVAAGSNFQYYLIMPLALVFTPMIPLFIVSILSMPIMYIVRLFKRSSIASLIVMILGYVVFMGAYFGIILSIPGGETDGAAVDTDALAAMILGPLKIASYVIYPNLFVARAMTGVNIGMNLPVYIAVMIAFFALSVGLAAYFYGKITTFSSQNVIVTHKARARDKVAGSVAALAKNDLLNLTRQPGLMFSSIIGLIIVPFITVIFGLNSAYAPGAMMFPMFGCGMNYMAMIAVSRERDKFFIKKYLPVTPKQYVNSKILISSVYVALMSIMVFISFLILRYNAIESLLCALMVLGFGLFLSGEAIKQDLKTPNLTWTTYKELSNRGKMLIYIFGSLIAGMVISFGGIFLKDAFGDTITSVILLAVDVVFFGLALYAHYALLKSADKYYYGISATNG